MSPASIIVCHADPVPLSEGRIIPGVVVNWRLPPALSNAVSPLASGIQKRKVGATSAIVIERGKKARKVTSIIAPRGQSISIVVDRPVGEGSYFGASKITPTPNPMPSAPF